MTNTYMEKEIKVLNVDTSKLKKRLEELGAKKVFDDNRIITTLDTKTRFYHGQDKLLRVTEEGSVKVSLHINNSKPNMKQVIKYKASRAKEVFDLFEGLELHPYTRVSAHRTSYEYNGIDFDIDEFPSIPPFCEIDLENLNVPLSNLLDSCQLSDLKVVDIGTEDIFKSYNLDYFELFKI